MAFQKMLEYVWVEEMNEPLLSKTERVNALAKIF